MRAAKHTKKSAVTPLPLPSVEEPTRTLCAAEPEHKVHYERVRDNIIAYVKKQWPAEEFTKPFCRHMSGIGWNKLDEYNDIVIYLPEGGGKLHFVTTLYKGGTFKYEIESYAAEVPLGMRKRTFMGFEV
jgi:hypothetical protein